MAGLGGIARIKSLDPRARRNFNRLSQQFENLLMAAPLELDADGKFSIDLGDGLVLSGTALVPKAGANVSVDAGGINSLPTVEWAMGGPSVSVATTAVAEDAAALARSIAWFL